MNTRNSSLKWLRRAGGQNVRLKAPAFTRFGGTTEVVPFPETMYETSARSRGHWLPAVEYWTMAGTFRYSSGPLLFRSL